MHAKGLPLTFKVSYKPYQLDPTLPTPGVDRMERLASKFGKYDRQSATLDNQ
jgi:predicted DsbA family dithiol-disulfide isomerase